jgi:hypothetical protein
MTSRLPADGERIGNEPEGGLIGSAEEMKTVNRVAR